MRKSLLLLGLSFMFLSCGSLNRTLFGTTKGTLRETVAIEQNCPKDNIKIINSVRGLHGATYAVDACGKRVIYKQVGSVFMEESTSNETINNLSQ